ncbi:MAG: hypothetical protein GY859_00570 [Desulfobacterales bacterium]|nr:hypothetical protein [Desulfobacterales bacterium]
MKQYLIDELRPEDYDQIKAHMDKHFGPSEMETIYWIPLADELQTDVQASHAECQPFYFVIDLESTLMSCELLVRTRKRMRCDCMGYADQRQRNYIIDLVDGIFEELGIKI